MGFKVEIRTTCKLCRGDITEKRYRSFCSDLCRKRFHSRKNQDKSVNWNRKRRAKIASSPDERKVQYLVCGNYYVQLGSHVVQAHGYKSCREYREEMKLDVKRGVVPKWYRELKGEITINNGTYENLKAGSKYRFVKGDSRAGKYKRSDQTLERLRNKSK